MLLSLHVEIRMLFKASMGFRRDVLKAKPEGEQETFLLYEHLPTYWKKHCDKGDAGFRRLACINRQCGECGVHGLHHMPEEQDTSLSTSTVTWDKFEYVPVASARSNGDEKKCPKIVTKTTTAGEMFAYFKTLFNSFPGHQFRAKWQQDQMKMNVDHLPSGHVCCVHDYSENYSCRYQDQLQSLYFSQTQASIHVTILHCHHGSYNFRQTKFKDFSRS